MRHRAETREVCVRSVFSFQLHFNPLVSLIEKDSAPSNCLCKKLQVELEPSGFIREVREETLTPNWGK